MAPSNHSREDDRDAWYRHRNAIAALPRSEVENAGRQEWLRAAAQGIGLPGATTAELFDLGAKIIAQKMASANRTSGKAAPRAAPVRRPIPSKAPGNSIPEPILQIDTFARSAANTATAGYADNVEAFMDALAGPGGFRNLPNRYAAELEKQHARDRYDAEHRKAATRAGQAVGLGLALGVPIGKGLKGARPISGAANTTPREIAAAAAARATTSAGTQAISDVASGRRPTLQDVSGAAVGGVAGAALGRAGPRVAGAAEGFTTGLAQDAFNDRPIDWQGASQAAAAGQYGAAIGFEGGRGYSDSLSMTEKGRLGEVLGTGRSKINGFDRDPVAKSRDGLLGRRYWYPDGRSGQIRFEDKFGYGVRLSRRQLEAQDLLGDNFVLYHHTPDDVGKLLGIPSSAVGSQLGADDDGEPWYLRQPR